MALQIQQLNADTTFLLTFAPPFAPDKCGKRFPGDFTILIDPWLSGHSSILHPTFQISHHTSEPVISTLRDIQKKVDLIIISQDKSDHCHKATLCSLFKNERINILATPAAAKKIRSWKHFDARQVHVMKAYNPNNAETVIRIPLQAYSSASAAGEITIANIPSKFDMTGLHNAVGITYQPPSSIFTLNTQFDRYEKGTTVKLSQNGISRPSTAPQRPRTASSSGKPANLDQMTAAASNPHLPQATSYNPKYALSIIYTPHGVPTRTLQPYVQSHLRALNAIPVTALFHSLNIEANPWFMGGQIAAGAPGGVELLKAMEARYWISAHDEVKDNKGVATTWIKSRQYNVGEAEDLLRQQDAGRTRVLKLGNGEVVRLPERQGERRVKEERLDLGLDLDFDRHGLPISRPATPQRDRPDHWLGEPARLPA